MGGPGTSNAQLDSDCIRRIPSNWTDTEPRVRFFRNGGCSGSEKNYGPGNYAKLHDNPFKMGDWAASILVPPNMSVTGYEHHDYKGKSATWGPGIHADLNNPNKGVGSRKMSSMTISRRKSWPEFLRDCCQGIEPESLCRNYAGPLKQACQSNMNHHCGLSLNWFKKPICRQWCENNQSRCDEIANQLCKDSEDPYCACFNAPSNIIRPSCFYAPCSAATAYQTLSDMNAARNCGEACIMQFNIDKVGRDALLENNTFKQECGTEAEKILDIEDNNNVSTGTNTNVVTEDNNTTNNGEGTSSNRNSIDTGTAAAIGGGGLLGLSSSFFLMLILFAIVAYVIMN